jgi:hypothetical protein
LEQLEQPAGIGSWAARRAGGSFRGLGEVRDGRLDRSPDWQREAGDPL